MNNPIAKFLPIDFAKKRGGVVSDVEDAMKK